MATADQALIGGAPAAADYFRSTVGIGDECTAAKVGHHLFLTAAHCVAVPRLYRQTPPPGYPANNGIKDEYVAGQPLLIQWGLDASGPSGTFTIVQTSIHPSWWKYPSSSDPVRGSDSAADIAVIEIAEDTPAIPEARVELDTIAPGTPVVEVGWGCEVSTTTPDPDLGRFKAHEQTTLPPEPELALAYPPLSEEELTSIKNAYLFTPGKKQDGNASSLCPGDSGGPLYLRNNSDPRVVGVNSNYTFTDDSGVSWDDWHTQTALGSFHGVGAWLKNLGVNTVGTPWNLDRIDQRAPTPADGYHYTGDGTGVHVYVLDSGIRATHQQFQGRIGEGWDFVENDADTDDSGPIGHGTGVASIIGGKDLGVARNVTLHAVRVLDQRMSGDEADATAGIQWVVDHHVSPAVINMSFTTPIYDAQMAQAVARAIDAGITVVVSAGNNGADACNYYPAGFPGVITVGASDKYDHRWVGDGVASNIGTCVELFAPGVDVETAGNWEDSATTTSSGTTEAAPHVAGAAAIYLGTH
ncbi:MAG TPA: S8 family serine peptidase, partial [Polyangiaceae bacterium]